MWKDPLDRRHIERRGEAERHCRYFFELACEL